MEHFCGKTEVLMMDTGEGNPGFGDFNYENGDKYKGNLLLVKETELEIYLEKR